MTSAIYQNIIVPTSLSGSSLSIDATSIESIKTGNVFSTAIVKVIFCYLDVKINIVFLARKIMLSVMYVFTPIAAYLWGINKNVNAVSIWFGELITNSAMAFFYGITYTIMCVMINASGATGWFFTMMWMFSMMKISEVLRNSLQGIFARLSGINEQDMGKGAVGVVGGAFTAAKAVAGAGRKMSLNKYAGTGATADANGNTKYSKMKDKSMERHNGKNSDYVRTSEGQNINGISKADAYISGSRKGKNDSENSMQHKDIGGNTNTNVEKSANKNAAHSQYSDMLYSNYDNEVLKSGQKSSSMGTGGNKVLNAVEAGNRIRNAQVRKNAAGQAIASTVDKMVQDSQNKDSTLYKLNNRPINHNEAAKVLFGNDNTKNQQKSFIRNARINNINGAKQIIASTNPYINADSKLKWSD